MLDLNTILIVDATMIVGVLFVESIGRAIGGAERGVNFASFMASWGYVALLPFSMSAIFGLLNNEAGTTWACGIGFVGFVSWFLILTTGLARTKDKQCQYVIHRNKLEQHLKGGYVVVTVLQDGNIVVE